MTPRILLTGASGGLGSRVLHHFLHTLSLPKQSLLVSTSKPYPKSPNAEGVELRYGDFLKPETLSKAFADVSVLLLISYPSIAHSLRVGAHKNAIDASIRAGVEHIVYTSLAFAGDSRAEVMQAHIDTEEYLKHTCARSGSRFTILREGIYTESYPLYLGFLDVKMQEEKSKREVYVPPTRKNGIAWAARDELGEATARIVLEVSRNLTNTDGGRYTDKLVLLSGPRAVNLEEVAAAVSKALGWEAAQALQVHEVSEDEFVAHHSSNRGGGEEAEKFVRSWASTFPAIAKGELAVIDPSLEVVLGRKPKDFYEIFPGLLQDRGDAKGSITQYAK